LNQAAALSILLLNNRKDSNLLERSVMAKGKKWFPLESNPSLMNSYISKLGFDTSLYSFVDVFSTEDWALDMIPSGSVAVVFLYPINDVQEQHRSLEKATNDAGVWHIKQRIGNACGTIGILHALANIPESLKVLAISENSWLSGFFSRCPISMTSVDKAEILEKDKEIESKHDETTADDNNQTSRGSLDDDLITHFVAIVNVNGGLYELDGRKDGPIRHGDTSESTFLKDACQRVVQGFMDRDPEEVRFTIMALAPTQEEN
jgi:ubiquitin carboxyl-terminal hydrolase L3